MDVRKAKFTLKPNFLSYHRRLVERVDNMKRNVMGATPNACTLCGDRFGLIFEKLGLFGAKCFLCHDCKNAVCQKCGIESPSTTKKENIWLCKICAETREMWKKSNAWFFKGEYPNTLGWFRKSMIVPIRYLSKKLSKNLLPQIF